MKTPNKPLPKISILVAVAAMCLLIPSVNAAVVTSFLQPEPTSDIITSYVPASTGALGWVKIPGLDRPVAQSFITPGDSDYSMTAITMQFNSSLGSSFDAPAGFSISFYELASAGQNPSTGSFLSTQTGSMEPHISDTTAGSYFTFSLDSAVSLDSGGFYGYVLAFTSPDNSDYNLALRVSASDADPAGTRAWFGSGGTPTGSGETYVYYIEGTAIPEPGTLGLLGVAAFGVLCVRRRFR